MEEIRLTTWDGAKALQIMGRNYQPQLVTRWATHGKRLKGLKVAGSVERQTGGEKPFATRIAIFFWRR